MIYSQIRVFANIRREDKILHFVKNHRNCTKTDVINYMDKNGASPMTTHKILKALIVDKKIIWKPDKSNPRIHHLLSNDENAYNLIDKELSDLEDSTTRMSEPMNKIRRLRFHEFYLGNKEFVDLRNHFEFPYRNAFGVIFLYLLNWTNSKIQADDDLQIIYGRIFELLIKLHKQTFDMDETRDSLSPLIHQLEDVRSRSTFEAYAKNYGVNIELAINIVATIKNFEKRFLPKLKSS